MSEIINYILLFLIFAAFVFVAVAPVLLVMYITNKKQKKYFSMLAEKYKLEANFGKSIIVRNYLAAKGYINGKYTYIETSTLGNFYININSSNTRYRIPVVKISIKAEMPGVETFSIEKKRKIKTEISLQDFNDYFKINIKPGQLADLYLTDRVKQEIINFAKKYKNLYIHYANNYIITYAMFEMTKKKRFEEVSEKTELLHKIVSNIPGRDA